MAEKFGRKLKKYNRAGTALLAGILLASVNVRTAAASTLARGPAWESEQMRLGLLTDEAAGNTVFNGDVNTLKAAAEASQLIVAVGNEADPAQGTLTWYVRNQEGKLIPAFSVPAVSGMNGISADKREGDKKTPSGIYSFTRQHSPLSQGGKRRSFCGRQRQQVL